VSARLADDDGFVIQRFADPRIGLQPDRLLALRVSDDRRPTEGDAPDEVHIHREIYRSRPDVRAVAHFHHDPTTMFTMADGVELVPMRNCSVRWRDGIPTHPDAARIATPGQGRALVATLAGAFAVQLRAHGQVVVAEDVPSLLTDAVHFVENADALATALRLGPVKPLTTAEGEAFLSTFSRIRHADKIWRYHVAAAVRDGAIPASWTDELLKETRPA
jgi:ribulose-5-phosphate 4-epimerase/fuculose-1-phosphate aldolase